ncbi:glycosyltransferase involved in cell wall biosynthesis [Silvimonas terrae]|uniref:Glycosyltransferase involved in cell wall biosynthesis n=1 Tax=Silvimonas terrae TaxID=300266 RepID=A0A840RIW0_9NEIS|nr:glycosyltransferase family 2 protein [Silvimonas terrae]MBB5192458.1 glycosyltransferase involved in cell wall biosynthesis [Silvimonas terrae]
MGQSSLEQKTGSSVRNLLFVPMYNCERQIPRVIEQLADVPPGFISEMIVVDNRSPDGGVAAAKAALGRFPDVPAKVMVNDGNYGLGGSHKVAFNYAIEHGFDNVIVLHGDDQGAIADLLPFFEPFRNSDADCLLGARFMKGARLQNYSLFRTFGNYVFNTLFSVAGGQKLYDLGSGLNLYRVKSLTKVDYLRNANDLTFNYYMILNTLAAGWKLRFFPISWREDDQVSNVKLFKQARRTLGLVLQFMVQRQHFLGTDHSGKPDRQYPSTVVYQQPAGQTR